MIDQGGGQQINIDPACAPTMQCPVANKLHHLGVWNRPRLMYPLIGSKKLSAASSVADKKFAVN